MTCANFPVVADGSPAQDVPIQSASETHVGQHLTSAEETGIRGITGTGIELEEK
jgi:hypothetical protein